MSVSREFGAVKQAKSLKIPLPKNFKKSLAKVWRSDSLSAPFDPKGGGQHVCRPITGFHQGNRIDGLADFKELLKKTFIYAS
jgi:hypothetical protein